MQEIKGKDCLAVLRASGSFPNLSLTGLLAAVTFHLGAAKVPQAKPAFLLKAEQQLYLQQQKIGNQPMFQDKNLS